MPLASGDKLGPYEIREILGVGGMGVVYRAFDSRLRRDVAIKILPESLTEASHRARFEREGQAVAALSHPNVLSVFDVGTENDVFYIVSELLEGETLRERLRKGPLPPATALDFARQAALALNAAHTKGIVHRDIKPENLFITTDGRLKVLDFGLAALVAQHDAPTAAFEREQLHLTAPDTVLGTIGYMSPEQVRGEVVDHRSDIFSLGCVIYEMVGGRSPFSRRTQTATVAAILNEPPDFEALSALSPQLRTVLERCLAKDKNHRFESATVLAEALQVSGDHATSRLAPQGGRRSIVPVIVLAVLLLALLSAAFMFSRRRAAPPASAEPVAARKRTMLAVLPFENLSADPAQEYFSDGLTEDTTTEFGRVSPERLGVIARTSVMRYKTAPADARTIGRELGVDYLVEGSVRRAGNRIRVAAQLVRTSDGTQLWAETYDRTADDVFAIQSELARDVAATVQIKVLPSAVRSSGRRNPAPANAEAREAFLRGRYHLNLGTPDDRRKAVEHLEEALAADPGSALVQTELARALLSLSTIDFAPHEIVPKAREHVDKALQLDDSVPEAHEVLATMLLEYYWNWPEAERELARAIALDPNFARAHASYATLLVSAGRTEPAMQHALRARQLDPLALTQHRNFLIALFAARRWDDAVAQAQRVLEQEPTYDIAYAVAALAHSARGEKALALGAARKVVEMSKVPVPRAMVAYVLAQNGETDTARKLLEELRAAAEKRFVCFFNVATVHAAFGEKDKAFDALDRAIRDKSG